MRLACSRLTTVLACLGGAIVGLSCNALTGAADLTADEIVDGPTPPPRIVEQDASPGGSEAGVDAPPPAGWRYQRTVTLTSDAADPLADYAVLVTLPEDFDGSHASPSGDDVRIRLPGAKTVLDHYIEDWPVSGARRIWVKVPAVTPGESTLELFYGNTKAPPASSFEATFPRAMRTAGGGAGSFEATEDIDVDWFELRAGDTLKLAKGAPLEITARRIVIAGTIDGNGAGHLGGAVPTGAGAGPGGGQPLASNGAGGGGYGGNGGNGGSDETPGGGGAGGAANGTADGIDLAMGSGGGTTNAKAGGAGGGALTVLGWRVTATGTIRMNGAEGVGGASGQCGGGGAGGGIFFGAAELDLAGASLEAQGGGGGKPTDTAADGGGGGAGGRIKLQRRTDGSYAPPAASVVTGGAAGDGGGTTAPGQPGGVGTTSEGESAAVVPGVTTALGPERTLP